MKVTYTNTTNITQYVHDSFLGLVPVAPGVTASYFIDDALGNPVDLLVLSETVGAVLYIGYARAGTAENVEDWAVAKVETVAGVEKKLWAGGMARRRYKWSDHLTLSYS